MGNANSPSDGTSPPRQGPQQQQSGSEVSHFVQSLFDDNANLGYMPLTLNLEGQSVVKKAFIKKAKPRTLPFDVLDQSFKMARSSGDNNLYALTFRFDATTPLIIEVFFKSKEQRTENGTNVFLSLTGSHSKTSLKFGAGINQEIPGGHILVKADDFQSNDLALGDGYSPILIKMSKSDTTFSKKSIESLYVYLSFKKNDDQVLTPVFEKKGKVVILPTRDRNWGKVFVD